METFLQCLKHSYEAQRVVSIEFDTNDDVLDGELLVTMNRLSRINLTHEITLFLQFLKPFTNDRTDDLSVS